MSSPGVIVNEPEAIRKAISACEVVIILNRLLIQTSPFGTFKIAGRLRNDMVIQRLRQILARVSETVAFLDRPVLALFAYDFFFIANCSTMRCRAACVS